MKTGVQPSTVFTTLNFHLVYLLGGLWSAFLWPVVHILGHNFGELQKFGFGMAFQVAAYCAAAAVIATAGVVLAARRLRGDTAALFTAATTATVLFFFFGPIHTAISETLTDRGFTTGAGVSFLLLTIACFGGIWIFRHKRALHAGVAAFTCIAALTATVELGIRFNRQTIDIAAKAEAAPFARSPLYTSPRLPADNGQAFSGENVFYIVVDGYTGDRHLRRLFDLDLTPFVTEMEKLGFTYLSASRSNYTASDMSIGSLFHLDYFHDAMPEAARTNPADFFPIVMDRSPPPALIKILRSSDYLMYLSESWYSGCKNRYFKCIYEKSPLAFNQLSQEVFARTPLKRLFRSLFFKHVDAIHPIDTAFFDRLRQNSAPAFVFAHHMQPHAPHYFDGGCNTIYTADKPGRLLYKYAATCTNKRIVELTKRILAFDPNAIVVIHADHGSSLIINTKYKRLPEDTISHSALDERTETFAFVRAPDACKQWLKPTLGPINTMRFVLGCLSRNEPRYLPERVLVTRNRNQGIPDLAEYFGFSGGARNSELAAQPPNAAKSR